MPETPLNDIIHELGNSLQAASSLSKVLRRTLAEQSQDVAALEEAIERAVRAVRELRPKSGGER
jgi:hypothetical protein